jgi:hypothetical protein
MIDGMASVRPIRYLNGVRRYAQRIAGHDLLDWCALSVEACADNPHQNIYFGENACGLSAIQHNQCADVAPVHFLYGINDASIRAHSVDRTCFVRQAR